MEEYNKYIKEDNEIFATKKAYELLYKSRGYKKAGDTNNEGTEQPKTGDKGTNNPTAYDDITKSDISQLLDGKGIEHNSRDTKQELYDLLLGSD